MARRRKPSGRKMADKGQRLRGRAVNTRALRPTFLIVCEGKQTEPNYFRKFRVNAHVVIRGLGAHTIGLVQETRELQARGEYNQVWCVMDRDSFPAQRFNDALVLARENGIQVAYSNQAFELWYVLHFGYHQVATDRSEYARLLTLHLGEPYHKNSAEMYDLLQGRQPDAIRNAARLLESHGARHNPEKDNPCTTVHLLVQELNRHLRD
jgi:hypothetical protein